MCKSGLLGPHTRSLRPLFVLASRRLAPPQEQLYRVLLLLADLPRAPAVRAAAGRLLQQLPTCGWVPAALLEALQAGQGQAGEQAAAALRRLLLGPGADGGEGSRGGGVKRPGLLLYTLQVRCGAACERAPALFGPFPLAAGCGFWWLWLHCCAQYLVAVMRLLTHMPCLPSTIYLAVHERNPSTPYLALRLCTR